jgi:hypothetical protein
MFRAQTCYEEQLIGIANRFGNLGDRLIIHPRVASRCRSRGAIQRPLSTHFSDIGGWHDHVG